MSAPIDEQAATLDDLFAPTVEEGRRVRPLLMRFETLLAPTRLCTTTQSQRCRSARLRALPQKARNGLTTASSRKRRS